MIWQDIVADGSGDVFLGRRTAAAVAVAQVAEQAEARMWAALRPGLQPWQVAAQVAARRLGLEPATALRGVTGLGAVVARVEASAADPRRFALAAEGDPKAGTPALLLTVRAAEPEDDDLVALSLAEGSGRFWRLTARCAVLGEACVEPDGTLALRQDAHGWAAASLKAAANERACEAEVKAAYEAVIDGRGGVRERAGGIGGAEAVRLPLDHPARIAWRDGFKAADAAREAVRRRWAIACRPPGGTLVLDPAAVDWTRRGALAHAERIEIVDAPADGKLGRALMKLNPRIGRKGGVPLFGAEPARAGQGRQAA